GTASRIPRRRPSTTRSSSTPGGSTPTRTRPCGGGGSNDLPGPRLGSPPRCSPTSCAGCRSSCPPCSASLCSISSSCRPPPAAPGGRVGRMLARLEGTAVGATTRFSGGGSGGELMQRGSANRSNSNSTENNSTYRGARGLPPELIKRIEKMYGFDKPVGERFL